MAVANHPRFARPCAVIGHLGPQSSFGIVGCMSTAAVHAPTETTIVNVLITIHIMSAPIADGRKVLPAWCSKFVTIGAGMGSAQNYLIRAAMTRAGPVSRYCF